MERFKSIYLFTTENIAAYMKDLDLTNKKIITVAASGDHLLNAVLLGAKDITCFDINPLTKKYIDLKLAAIKELSFEEFKDFLLYDNEKSFDYEIIKKLNINEDSKSFWLKTLDAFSKNGLLLRKSDLINTKFFNPSKKIEENLYLKREKYDIIRANLLDVQIKFIETNIKDLKLDEDYDYMFLSNISDYLKDIYDDNYLEKYKNLIDSFKKKVKHIYFAYVYDINNKNKRSLIDDSKKVKEIFEDIKIKTFSTAFETNEDNVYDAVYITGGGI